MVEEVRRILEATSHIQTLGIKSKEKASDDGEIRKQYRKLALLVHPDKCLIPEAKAMSSVRSLERHD